MSPADHLRRRTAIGLILESGSERLTQIEQQKAVRFSTLLHEPFVATATMSATVDMRVLAQRALSESAQPDEAITVNQRALIDKVRSECETKPQLC